MKFRTSRDTLLRPLQVLTGVIERRHTLPVLSNILLETSENGLTLRGTDLEVEMVAELSEGIEVEHQEASATTVPAHTLSDIWRSLPEAADVTFALEGQRVVLRSGRSRYQAADGAGGRVHPVRGGRRRGERHLAPGGCAAASGADELRHGEPGHPLLSPRTAPRDQFPGNPGRGDGRRETRHVHAGSGCGRGRPASGDHPAQAHPGSRTSRCGQRSRRELFLRSLAFTRVSG